MNDIGMPKQWTEEQWHRVQQVVHDQALKTRVAARFLPLVGPLPPGTATVPAERVREPEPEIHEHQMKAGSKSLKAQIKAFATREIDLQQKLTITLNRMAADQSIQSLDDIPITNQLEQDRRRYLKDLAKLESQKIDRALEVLQGNKQGIGIEDGEVLPLITVAVFIRLSTTQQSEPDLVSALTLFARAANIVARTEDSIIFEGKYTEVKGVLKVEPGPDPDNSLLGVPGNNKLCLKCRPLPPIHSPISSPLSLRQRPNGRELVERVAEGVSVLDGLGHLAPYALVLGADLFVAAETPSRGGLVLPSDRIRPLIEGPLLRSGSLPLDAGVLVSLPANPVEIVVASDIHVRFLQLTEHSQYLYRVSQRFALRIKEPKAILTLQCCDTW